MKHSCGCVAPLLDRLCNAGVDILDPVQITAKDMEPESLMQECGYRLIFHGGIDTQNILRTAPPETVAKHVREIIEKLSGGCGYILAPTQIFQRDIPVENIVAAYQIAMVYNKDDSK
jgi:uroporphyrinogen decarboxylase